MPSAGSTFFTACGITISDIVWVEDSPSERPASDWPRSTAIMPARMISATYAAELMPKAILAITQSGSGTPLNTLPKMMK